MPRIREVRVRIMERLIIISALLWLLGMTAQIFTAHAEIV